MIDPDDMMDGEFEMGMKFVVVKTEGGPYDDGAYVAGFELGALNARLEAALHHGLGLPQATIHRENLPQADLLAMQVGATMEELPWPSSVDDETAGEWAWVKFEWMADLHGGPDDD